MVDTNSSKSLEDKEKPADSVPAERLKMPGVAPEDALRAFMEVDPNKIKPIEEDSAEPGYDEAD